ncbi:hypothetical protein DK47_3170 [Brucella abortus 2308]|nr:hypothetical protein DK66_3095 [Brucella suis 1330]KFJ50777.1 hypothetical protein DK47_3170 [Brucella abortus 2308]
MSVGTQRDSGSSRATTTGEHNADLPTQDSRHMCGSHLIYHFKLQHPLVRLHRKRI